MKYVEARTILVPDLPEAKVASGYVTPVTTLRVRQKPEQGPITFSPFEILYLCSVKYSVARTYCGTLLYARVR